MMSSGATLRPSVLAAKEWLVNERAKLKEQHDRGSPGIQVCNHLADLWDQVVLRVYEESIAELPAADRQALEGKIALVAHGGYGRREVAPYSDVDLMILHSARGAKRVAPLARRMVCDLFDIGLIVGQSVRSVSEACELALKDATIFTSLVEARFLAGSESLFARFQRKFQAATQRNWRRLVAAVDAERGQERLQFGDTAYLLEPNVKRSPGGLRDIQLLRWVGYARYGQASPDLLERSEVLATEDHQVLQRAAEFLLRVRNEMQFHGAKAQDVLDRVEQMRQAQVNGFTGSEGILPVEQFMREYFRHTSPALHIVRQFVEGARRRGGVSEALAPMVSRREGNYRIGPRSVWGTPAGLQDLQGNLEQILRLVELAQRHNRRIAHNTWEAVRRAVPSLPNSVTPMAAALFLEMLERPQRLGEVLHDLHEVGVLEKLIPAMEHARGLLQFNEYHKFTVDEHCLRAVEAAAALARDARPSAEVYRAISQKRILHLALLIHDLGKGYVEDHSEVGGRIATETAARLHLPPHDAESLRFLVHKHLIMSHLGLRRDTSDDRLILNFAVEVGSPEVLNMLYVLTCADLAAVGPGVLTSWKEDVLHDLYVRTLRHLSGDSPSLLADEQRARVKSLCGGEARDRWFDQQADALPSAYLTSTPPEQVAAELGRLRKLRPREVEVWHRVVPETKTVEYTIGTYDDITPGIVFKLTGALSSQGLQILSADINTLVDGLVLDRFRVQDPDYTEGPPPERQQEIERRLKESLVSGQVPPFRKVWGGASRKSAEALPKLPTQVRVDNSTSQQFTIIDVFAADRTGLLYTTARALFELGLSVSLARIGTYLDQSVDVFYVTDQKGRKIVDDVRLEQIRTKLLETIERFLAAS